MRIKLTKDFLEIEARTKNLRQIARETGYSSSYINKLCQKYAISSPLRTKIKKEDMIGKVFTNLTVIEQVRNNKHNTARFKCLCKCGNEKEVDKCHLLNGMTRSCGCLAAKKRYGDISGAYFNNIRRCANQRDIEFNITIQDIWTQYLLQDKRCKLTNLPIKFAKNFKQQKEIQSASLDRIDSSKGYVIGNIQIVHKRVNAMKGNLDQEEFNYWIFMLNKTINPCGVFQGEYKTIYDNCREDD